MRCRVHAGGEQELSRLKVDYMSEDVADTIRNLRHHIVITDRWAAPHHATGPAASDDKC